MIKFPCRCGRAFEVEDDQAGASFQCPSCGVLLDVPTLSDAKLLAADGTYSLDPDGTVAPPQPGRLHALYETFTRDTVDATTGQEIDLRPTMEEIRRAHSDEPLKRTEEDERHARPRYDPVTGELVRPFALDNDEPVRVAPAATALPGGRPRTLGYAPVAARGQSNRQSPPTLLSAWGLAMELFEPVNLAVLIFVFVFYIIGQVALYSLVLTILCLPLVGVLLAHYGNVIDETGPEARDELPRPMRQVALGDDIIRPFFRMALALMICYAPPIVLGIDMARSAGAPRDAAAMVMMAGLILGTSLLPAMMLTTVASGTLMNLRPDRVLSVITVAGFRYVVAMVLWAAVVALHLFAFISTVDWVLMSPAVKTTQWKVLHHPGTVYGAVTLAIYLAHYYCWYLGLLFRGGEHRFKWVFQEHERARKRPSRGIIGR